MTDIKSKEERSKNMAAIKGKNTKPEIYLRKLLFKEGFRFRNNVSYIYGHPDIYLAKYKVAIFVHGCFWHRHENCKYAYIPKTRTEFWLQKFEKNRQRDQEVRERLEQDHVRVLIVWECTIKQMQKDTQTEAAYMQKILTYIRNGKAMFHEL